MLSSLRYHSCDSAGRLERMGHLVLANHLKCQHRSGQDKGNSQQPVDFAHGDCGKGWQSVENPAAKTARDRDHIQDDQTACPAQVGQQINEAVQLS